MTSWFFLSLSASLVLALFCALACFKTLAGTTDPTEDGSSTRGLRIEPIKVTYHCENAGEPHERTLR